MMMLGCMGRTAILMLALFVMGWWLGEPAVSKAEDPDYPRITGPCNCHFPKDHGPHPDYKTEWWYYTGNLKSVDGRRFGFQLTFFRSRVLPPGAEASWPDPKSAWRAPQVILAHAALTDIDGKRFLHAEEMARAALGMAGASIEPATGAVDIFVKDWRVRITPETHELRAAADDFGLDLDALPERPPVLHGDAGYSLKGSTPERSSCYYSFTRLKTTGDIILNGEALPVTGESWMDHEFSSAPLEPGIAGWNWWSIQLANGSDLMIYLLRKSDGTFHPASGGTLVDARGKAVHLGADDVRAEATGSWKSPHSGAVYPERWKIFIHPKAGDKELSLTVAPNLQDQEMRTPGTTGVTYWEGSISVEGSMNDAPVKGVGYMELTGYEKAFDAPM